MQSRYIIKYFKLAPSLIKQFMFFTSNINLIFGTLIQHYALIPIEEYTAPIIYKPIKKVYS